ncbi:hypothetical protein B566_EDAN003635 [Ephemera danica]|nr:hypothetical protein B566_EDAN003635 [Ephemera danica]
MPKPPTRVLGIAREAVQVTAPNDVHVNVTENSWLQETRMARAMTSFATMNHDLLQEIHHAATISRETEQAERCIKLLMKYPEAVNIPREPYGFTPFLFINKFVQKGANMEIRTNDGDTPMYLAVRALLETEERPRFTLLQLLLEAGGSVNVVNHSGYSPLHLAAANGSKRLVRWLVEKGASPFQRNSQGYRPIDLANLGGHVKVVPLLTVTVSSNHECKTDSDSSIISSSSASPFRQAPHRQLKRALPSQFVHPMVKISRLACSTHPRCTIQSETDKSKLTYQQLRDPRLNRSLKIMKHFHSL